MIPLIPRNIIVHAQAQALAGQLKRKNKVVRKSRKAAQKPDQGKSNTPVQ